MRCVLIGNYGVGNLGDEALKDYFLSTYLDVTWSIVVARADQPGEFPRLPTGIRSFFGTEWWKTIGAIRNADAVIFGGGSLFTDTESILACILWFSHAAVAFFFGKPVLLAFQGVGPFRSRVGEALAKYVLRRAVFVSVRDVESAAKIASWNMNIKVVQSFDPVIYDVRNKESHRSKNVLIVIPRRHSGDKFFAAVRLAEKQHPQAPIRVLLLQSSDAREREIARKLLREFESRVTVQPVHSIHELATEVSTAVLVVSERYHGAIAALGLGVPLTIVYRAKGDKLDELRAYAEGKLLIGDLVRLVHEGTAALRQALFSLEQGKKNV